MFHLCIYPAPPPSGPASMLFIQQKEMCKYCLEACTVHGALCLDSLCMCVCMCVCVCVCVYVYVCVCVCVCVCVYVCGCVRLWNVREAPMDTSLDNLSPAPTHRLHTCSTCTYSHTLLHVHMHMYLCVVVYALPPHTQVRVAWASQPSSTLSSCLTSTRTAPTMALPSAWLRRHRYYSLPPPYVSLPPVCGCI